MVRQQQRAPVRKSQRSPLNLMGTLIGFYLVNISLTMAQPAAVVEPPTERRTENIDQAWILIEKLASPSFAERQSAHKKLLRMRNRAYDVLLEARNHENAEVRLAVRGMLDSVEISWLHDDDPQAVVGLLKGYGERPANVRKSIVDQLARLDEAWECWALIRIVRFDSSEALSKRAALAIMQRCGDRARESLWQQELISQVQNSRRVSAHWLRHYPGLVNDLANTAPDFSKLIQNELTLVSQNDSDPTVDPNLGLELSRWFVRWKLSELPDSDESELIEQMSWLVQAGEPAAKEHLDWLAALRQWPAIVQWSLAQGERLDDWPEVQFRVAEAHRQLGQDEEARVRGLLGIQSLPAGLEDRETIAHGLYALHYPVWAIKVLQNNLEQTDPGTEMDWRMRVDAAVWLEDQCRWVEAAKVLGEGIEFADSRDDGWNSVPEKAARSTLRSEQLRLQALALQEKTPAQQDEYRELLDKALSYSPRDLNLIVLRWAACRQPPIEESSEWQQRIDALVGQLQDKIERIDQDLSRFPIPNIKLHLEREQVARCVTLAHVLCNTDSDADQAIRLSRKALEVNPEDPDAWHALALSLSHAGQTEQALTACQEALQRRPQSIRFQRFHNQLTASPASKN